MSVLWTVDDMIAAMDARPVGQMPQAISGISIDTRTVRAGEAFFAIKGDVHDGHDFVSQAMKAGAALAVVAQSRLVMFGALRLPLLVVADVLQAMEKLGMAARRRVSGKIIAVTGSAGKTTTKELLRTALSASGKVHASAASFNNHWGVPLTLARMAKDVDFGVFEIGMNHPGEITPLVGMVKPDVAIITTIAPAHLGSFASVDEIARAKAEIFTGLGEGGTALVNRDVKQYALLKRLADAAGVANLVSFGKSKSADCRLLSLEETADGSQISARVGGESIRYFLPLCGEHQAVNSLAVLGAAHLCGADLGTTAKALAQAKAEAGRGRRHQIAVPGGAALLIDESYNANPGSMEAALKVLGAVQPRGRRIAVLGDMLELGESSGKLHRGLKKSVIEAKPDLVLLAGSEMAGLADELFPALAGRHFADASGLGAELQRLLTDGDVVMLKASKGTRFAGVVDLLTSATAAATPA